ncbi:VOC family protein [Paenibacillus sp. TH7-28]
MIHHVELNVSDLPATIDFWGWLLTDLGYREYQKWQYGISWKHGESYIVFVQTEEKYLDIPYHRKRTGLNHLAFYARSRRHVDELTEKLTEKGVTVLYKDKHPFAGGEGHYAVFCEDPDRIKVEFVAPE